MMPYAGEESVGIILNQGTQGGGPAQQQLQAEDEVTMLQSALV